MSGAVFSMEDAGRIVEAVDWVESTRRDYGGTPGPRAFHSPHADLVSVTGPAVDGRYPGKWLTYLAEIDTVVVETDIWVVGLNDEELAEGYYLAVRKGDYQGVPVWVTACCGDGGSLTVGTGTLTGVTHNLDPGTAGLLLLDVTAPSTLTGISGGESGRVVAITNTGTYPLTLTHLDSGSLAANQFSFPGGQDLVVSPGSTVSVVYDDAAENWLLLSTSPGVVQAPVSATISTDQDDYSVGDASAVDLNVTDPATLTGITEGHDGRLLTLHNTGDSSLTLTNEDSSSNEENRFALPNGQNVVLTPESSITLRYDDTAERWVVVSTSPGVVQVPAPLTVSTSQDDYDVGDRAFVALDVTDPLSITGITGGYDGRPLTLYNAGDSNLTLPNEDSGSTAANRLDLPDDQDFTLKPGEFVNLLYDAALGRWKLVTSATPPGASTATSPAWVKVTKTYSDFSAASTSNNIEIYSLPARGVIHGVILKHTTQFSGTGILGYTISVGISGTSTKYTIALSVTTSPSDTGFQANGGASSPANPQPEDFGSAKSIRAFAGSTGANLDQATQGSVDIWLLVSVLP